MTLPPSAVRAMGFYSLGPGSKYVFITRPKKRSNNAGVMELFFSLP